MRIRVLGTLVVEGVDLAAVGSRKGRTLLAALAAAGGQAVPTDELAELLWTRQLPAKPHDQLSVLTSRLRRVLGTESIGRSHAGYALRTEWIDVVELELRVGEAESRFAAGHSGAARAAAAAAVELVRGPLAAEESATWFDSRRRGAERLLGRARAILAQAAMATGDVIAAAAAAGEVLDDDPYDESSLRIVMRANVALGRPASALKAYADMRARLRDDLGVSPSPATDAVHDAILRGVEPGPRPPRARLLVGRERERQLLDRALAEIAGGRSAGVEVVGEAGIGKTALVTAFLEAANDRALVVTGRCDELGRELSLQPIVDGLDAQLRILPGDVVDELLTGDAALVAPLLGRSPSPAGRIPVGDGETERSSLYRSVLALIERIAAGRPTIIVVEDTHLAAASTAAWLQMALRRGRGILVLTTRRPEGGVTLAGATLLELGPLDVDDVAAWAGGARAEELTDRSGGNPLFLAELIAHEGDVLPRSIRGLVTERVDALGPAAATLRAAAVLGPAVDLDVLATVQQRPIAELLDDFEHAVRARLLVDERTGLRFRHELVREALVASTSTARRAFLHRQAATVLASRETADPMAIAWHAQRAGDTAMAAAALVRAAAIAASRWDHAEAIRLLDDAVALCDDGPTRLARARVRMAMWELDAARVDAERAIALGGSGPAFELAGWVAYYRRDHDDTVRLAEEGMAHGDDPEVRASCLSLIGRTRHTLGDLAAAEACLREAVATATASTRTVAQVWLAALLVHRGDDSEAIDLASRARHGLDRSAHPFAPGHALFALAVALGHRGRAADALTVLDDLDLLDSRGRSHQRFGAVASNCRGWVLRNLGALDEARACNEVAAALPADDPPLAEPRYAGLLDLVDHELFVGDRAAARRRIDALADVERWAGSMHWRHRTRYHLQQARLAVAEGDLATAGTLATSVAEDCRDRRARRYELLATLVGVHAGAVVGDRALASLLTELDGVAGLEAWWLTAEFAERFDDATLWRAARDRVETLAAHAGPHSATLLAHAAVRFERLAR